MKHLKWLLLLCLSWGTAQAQLKVSVVSAVAANGTPTYTQDFTDATTFGGATPKAMIILGSRAVADDTSTSLGVSSIVGFAAGSNSAVMSHADNTSASPNSAAYSTHNTKAYARTNTSGTMDGEATGAFIANGYRLSWTDQSAGELLKVILIGGTGIEAAVSTLTSNNGTSGQTVTHGLTGTPDFIIAMNAGPVSNNSIGAGSVSPAMGFWTASSQLSLAETLNDDGLTTVSSGGIIDSTHAIAQHASGGGASTWVGAISSVGASTFTITYNVAHTNTVYFLAVRSTGTPLTVKASTYTTAASTGNVADITGMATPPQILINLLNFQTVLDTGTSSTAGSEFGVGVALKNTGTSSTQVGTLISSDHDNIATSGGHGESRVSATNDIFLYAAGGGTTGTVATINSWDSGGITHNYSNVAAVSKIIPYLAFGDGLSTPTFTSAPAVGTRTTSSIPINFTSDTTGTVYGARLTDGSGTPTCDQLEAQTATGGQQYWSEAVVATVSDSHAFSSITDGTITDAYFCIEDGSGNDSAVATIANVYKLPAFSVSPSVTAQDDNDYTITKTLDGAGTVYAVACIKGSTAPTVTNVEAGQCNGGSTAIASTSGAATGTLTLGGSLTRPVHDIYVAGTYGSQHEAAVHTIANEMLDAPAGKQYVTLASIDASSFCADFNVTQTPLIAIGDILKLDAVTAPSSFTLTADTSCNLSYTGDSTRQLVLYDAYDTSVGDYMPGGPGSLWFNNQPPTPPPNGTVVVFAPLNSAMTPTDLTSQCPDPEGDTVTITAVTSLPPGHSITNNVLGGTGTSRGIYSGITLRCTDSTGAYVDW